MKHHSLYIICILLVSLSSCRQTTKIATYGDLYTEAPTTIYLAPVQDLAPRPDDRTMGGKEMVREYALAANYLPQTLATPLLRQGYYVLPQLVSIQIAQAESRSIPQLLNGDLSSYQQDYNIDAILFVTIHKWSVQNGGIVAYLEYALRSTKTGITLMHCWVKGHKRNWVNFHGESVPLTSDNEFAVEMELSDSEAQRCLLLLQVSDIIIRNLPTSSSRRQFRDDLYKAANPTYLYMFSNETGEMEVSPLALEKFEMECFAE